MNVNGVQLGVGLIICVIIGVVLFSFTGTSVIQDDETDTTKNLTSGIVIESQEFIIQSPSFNDNDNIPSKFTCDGENISPKLVWGNQPVGTESIVLIMDDPDAPNSFTHWVLFNLPADINELSQGVPSQNVLENVEEFMVKMV